MGVQKERCSGSAELALILENDRMSGMSIELTNKFNAKAPYM